MLRNQALHAMRSAAEKALVNTCEVLSRSNSVDVDGNTVDVFTITATTKCRVVPIPRTAGSDVDADARIASSDYFVVVPFGTTVVERDKLRVYNIDETGYTDYEAMAVYNGNNEDTVLRIRSLKMV